MISPVTNTPQSPPAHGTTRAQKTRPEGQSLSASQKSVQSKPQPTTDTVTISTSAQTFAQEAMETPEQTLKEAMSGDTQAQRLLAKESATQAAVNLSV
jgi:hypothetical protein